MFEKFFKWMKKNEKEDASVISENSTPARTVHILIDYENSLPQNLDEVPHDDNTHLWLFISKQTKLNAELTRVLQDFGDRSHQIYLDIACKQPNTLDSIFSYYIGYISAAYVQPKIAILSKDKMCETVVDHARKQYRLDITHYHHNDYVENTSSPVAEKDSISTTKQPIVDAKTTTNLFGRALREAIIYLTDPNKYYPPSRYKLEELLAKEIVMSIFSQEENFTEEHALIQAKKLVHQLQVSRLIEIVDKKTGKLVYHTNEESLYQRMKYFVLRKKPKYLNQLKEIIIYNYSHRDIQDKEVEALIKSLQEDKVLSLSKNNQISYQVEVPKPYDLNQLETKAADFIKRRNGLPKNKSSFYNVIGTHTNTKDNNEVLKTIIDRLVSKGLVRFENNQVFYPKKSNY